jgi:hypothetical protein
MTLPDGTEVEGECIDVEVTADRVQYLWNTFFDFLLEKGDGQRLYNGDDFQTKDVARSPGADQIREDFLYGRVRELVAESGPVSWQYVGLQGDTGERFVRRQSRRRSGGRV